MTIHKILYIPHPILATQAKPIEVFDEALQILIEDMFETMYYAKGVGLAAPQIGLSKHLAVLDSTCDKVNQMVLINPVILEKKNEVLMSEACLSIPGTHNEIKRATEIVVQAYDRHGKIFKLTAKDFLAEIIQHEVDHLNGIVYIDHLSPLKRARAVQQHQKFKRTQAKRK